MLLLSIPGSDWLLPSVPGSDWLSLSVCVLPDVFVDWKQNANEVIVRLRCGDGVQRAEDVRTTFTDTTCHAHFPGTLLRYAANTSC